MRKFILAAAALASFAAVPAFASEGTYAPVAVASGFDSKGPVAVLQQVPRHDDSLVRRHGAACPLDAVGLRRGLADQRRQRFSALRIAQPREHIDRRRFGLGAVQRGIELDQALG